MGSSASKSDSSARELSWSTAIRVEKTVPDGTSLAALRQFPAALLFGGLIAR